MRSKPDIDVKLSRSVLAGETLEVELLVVGRSVTPIDGINVHFRLEEVTMPSLQAQPEVHQRHHEVATVAELGALSAEEHRYSLAFEIPERAPATYAGTLIAHRASVEIHVAIPWWFDVRERYDVTIASTPVERPAAVPFTGSSLQGNEPFVELSLRAQSFAPGETIHGAVAFGNLDGYDATGLEVSLVSFESVPEGRGPAYEATRHPAFLAAPSHAEGREIPFRLAVPASASPSFKLRRGSLSWRLEVRLNLSGARDVVYQVPVTIAVFEGRERKVSMESAPIGAGRWRAVWAEAGAAAELALDRRKLQLTGELSGCDVVVRVGKNEAKRSSLVARLRWEGWGLGLTLANARTLDLGTYFQDEELERRFKITGRDPAQLRAAFTPALRAALLAFDEVTLGDDLARVTSDAPGHDQPWIGDFLARVTALARAIAAASRAIPPPEAMAAFLPAWRRFAADLDGDLCVGNMAITAAAFEGSLAAIRTEIDDREPAATTITLAIDPSLEAAFDAEDATAVAAASPQARALLASIAALCVPILEAGFALPPVPRVPSPSVTPDQVSIRLPVVLANPASARELMAALLSLAAALRGERRNGPYR